VTPLVRRYIKTSFLFLLAGLLLGGWIVVAEFLAGRYPPRRRPPAASGALRSSG